MVGRVSDTLYEPRGAPGTDLVLQKWHPLPLLVQLTVPAMELPVATKGNQGAKATALIASSTQQAG